VAIQSQPPAHGIPEPEPSSVGAAADFASSAATAPDEEAVPT
jgi:hypothetical protein